MVDWDIELEHCVQFYDSDESALIANVVRYLADGYRKGSSLCVLATQPHCTAFIGGLEALGIDAQGAIDAGRFVLLDAEETLRGFMAHGYPDATLFEGTCGAVVRALIERAQGCGVRAYGEIVGLLWRAEKIPAAIRLEQLWHDLQSKVDGFTLFCGYPIDIFGHEFVASAVDGVLCTHTSVVPSGNDEALYQALSDAMAHVFGVNETAQILTHITRGTPRKWGSTPRGETMILQLRKNMPQRAGEVLALARSYFKKAG